MKRSIYGMIAAILILCGSAILISCSENHNPANTPSTVGQAEGMWWSMCEQEGTYNSVAYKILHAVCLNEDETGYGISFFFNDEDYNLPNYSVGGHNFAPLTYTTAQNGQIKLNFDKASTNMVTCMNTRCSV